MTHKISCYYLSSLIFGDEYNKDMIKEDHVDVSLGGIDHKKYYKRVTNAQKSILSHPLESSYHKCVDDKISFG